MMSPLVTCQTYASASLDQETVGRVVSPPATVIAIGWVPATVETPTCSGGALRLSVNATVVGTDGPSAKFCRASKT